jgi:hypothetical protein
LLTRSAVGEAACAIRSGVAVPTVTATARQAMRISEEVVTIGTPSEQV